MIDWATDAAANLSAGVVLVVPADQAAEPAFAVPEGATLVVAGGSSRSESVRCGLAAVPADAEIICVHDAARPFATHEIFERVVAAVRSGADAAVPAVEVADTIKVVDRSGRVVATPDRSTLRAVQTPQAFRADVLRAAHQRGGDATDDAGLVEAGGGYVVVVQGDVDNRKVTSPADWDWAVQRATEGGFPR